VKELSAAGQPDAEGLPTLPVAGPATGLWDDCGRYKKRGMSWATVCQELAAVSRVSADRLINCLEEFGANYFRLSELMQISGETYRLIAGSVSEDRAKRFH
jgi:hypothetical protein